MIIKVLGSSSKGNCYILETPTGKLLLECGIRFKDILQALDFNISDVGGVLISHSHQDHCKAIHDVIKAGINVYTSKGTSEALGIPKHHRITHISADSPWQVIGDFAVMSFETEHDAPEPLCFLVQYIPTGEKLLFATDTYYLRYKFVGLNYIMVECNYCNDILDTNIQARSIIDSMKDRLLKSHFSLNNCKGFLKATDRKKLKKIVLIHLSDGNSNAARMQKEIEELTEVETVVADSGMEIELNLNPF